MHDLNDTSLGHRNADVVSETADTLGEELAYEELRLVHGGAEGFGGGGTNC